MKVHGLIIQWYVHCVLMHFWKHCISRLTMEQDCIKSMMSLVDKCFYSIQLHSDWRVKHGCQSISIILYFYTNVEIIADQFPLAEHVFNYVQIWCNLHASSVWSRQVWSESFLLVTQNLWSLSTRLNSLGMIRHSRVRITWIGR